MKLTQLHQDNASSLVIQTLERIEGAYAPATIRAFKADFNTFITYCIEHQTNPLPANPSVVSHYKSGSEEKIDGADLSGRKI